MPDVDVSNDVNPLDALAEDFVLRYRNGERPALTEYTDRHPELADEILELFPALMLMEDARPGSEQEANGFSGVRGASSGKKLERLGDFRILREVGRGGMGIVYEAEQESLGRHVALKVLPMHALLDSRHLQRFQRESRAAARLHHTNIVPVFGVGEQDGLHYFVMQFIHGLELDQVLVELKRMRKSGRSAPTNATGLEADAGTRSYSRPRSDDRPSATSLAEVMVSGQVGAASDGTQKRAASPAVDGDRR